MKSGGYISCLPSWIKCSEFVRQYEEDFPEEEVLKLDDKERLFELPSELCEDSAVKVMDNIRYFGVNEPITRKIFEFYVEVSNRDYVEPHKKSFPEFIVLWKNVEFAVAK